MASSSASAAGSPVSSSMTSAIASADPRCIRSSRSRTSASLVKSDSNTSRNDSLSESMNAKKAAIVAATRCLLSLVEASASRVAATSSSVCCSSSASDRVLAANPRVDVRPPPVRLTAANALEVLGGYDVVLDGADNFPTRYLVDDACAMLGIPDVWGSILGFDGQTGVFWAPHGPTYRELFPQPPTPGSVPSCAEGGVLGALCATVGSVMATEAVKLVCGVGEPLVGRLLVLEALGGRWRTLAVRAPEQRRAVTELIDYDAFCAAPAHPGPVPADD